MTRRKAHAAGRRALRRARKIEDPLSKRALARLEELAGDNEAKLHGWCIAAWQLRDSGQVEHWYMAATLIAQQAKASAA